MIAAYKLKALRRRGDDPVLDAKLRKERQKSELEERKAERARNNRNKPLLRARKAAAQARMPTSQLRKVAEAWLEENASHWTDAYYMQISSVLRDHVYPDLGDRPIESIDPAEVLDVLSKLLKAGKVETARRVRQRLDAIFEHSALRYKTALNPVAVVKREITKRVKAARKFNPQENFPCVSLDDAPQLLQCNELVRGSGRSVPCSGSWR